MCVNASVFFVVVLSSHVLSPNPRRKFCAIYAAIWALYMCMRIDGFDTYSLVTVYFDHSRINSQTSILQAIYGRQSNLIGKGDAISSGLLVGTKFGEVCDISSTAHDKQQIYDTKISAFSTV